MKEKVFSSEAFSLVRLTPAEETLVQRLCERSADYIQLVAGRAASPTEAHDLYLAHPEGKSNEDKLLIGVVTGTQELIGVLDVIRDHPHPGEWYLGLLLLDPAWRGQGWGEKVYHVFEAWAWQEGTRAVRLTVAEQNKRAYRFWQRMGFVELERRPPALFGEKESIFIVMRRVLKE